MLTPVPGLQYVAELGLAVTLGSAFTKTVTLELHEPPQLSVIAQVKLYEPAGKFAVMVDAFGYTPPTPSLHI